MATRKRASTRSKLLKRAVKAGRSALRQATYRVEADVVIRAVVIERPFVYGIEP